MITMRQYFTVVTFLVVCVLGFAPIIRWLQSKRADADAKEAEDRVRELERQRREDARAREIREERAYLSRIFYELRRAMDLSPEGSEFTRSPDVAIAPGTATGADGDDGERPNDPTEELLNEALGPALTPNTGANLLNEEPVHGPIFKRCQIPDPDDPKVSIFEIEETRSKTRLVADRNFPHHRDAWAFIIHIPTFSTMADSPRPRAFGQSGFDWTKWVPFTTIPADAPERALDELEAWFLRLALGEEQPTGGGFAKSCAQWDDYEEDPKTRGYRILWLAPSDE